MLLPGHIATMRPGGGMEGDPAVDVGGGGRGKRKVEGVGGGEGRL